MHNAQASTPIDVAPAAGGRGPHLLDVSMFWDPGSGVRRMLAGKRAVITEQGWRHSLLAPGACDPGQIDCGGVVLPRTGGCRCVFDRSGAQRLIEKACPDIIEVADPYTLAWAAVAARQRLGIPVVACCLSNLPALMARRLGGPAGASTRRGQWAERQAGAYLAHLYADFDLVWAPSRTLTALLHHWGVTHAVYQSLGIDSAVFTPSARDPQWRRDFCQQLGLSPAARLLVYTGRFGPEKNLPLLAEAVRLLGPDFALLAVGAGPCPPRGTQVRVLPPIADDGDLARLLASCDAYVHAGDQEPAYLGALEAMACGTPLVVPSSGALGELAQDVAMTIDGLDPADWADAICVAVSLRSHTLDFRALDRARRHDWTRVIGPMAQHYRRLMRRGPAGSVGRALSADDLVGRPS